MVERLGEMRKGRRERIEKGSREGIEKETKRQFEKEALLVAMPVAEPALRKGIEYVLQFYFHTL